jgi:hypothetical protein
MMKLGKEPTSISDYSKNKDKRAFLQQSLRTYRTQVKMKTANKRKEKTLETSFLILRTWLTLMLLKTMFLPKKRR